jgi:putative FmdB family regulatory protein
MPIYEFKCQKCNNFFEILVIRDKDQIEMKCPSCKSDHFERVMSATNFSMSGGSGTQTGSSAQTRTCSGGSCTTYEIPGPK